MTQWSPVSLQTKSSFSSHLSFWFEREQRGRRADKTSAAFTSSNSSFWWGELLQVAHPDLSLSLSPTLSVSVFISLKVCLRWSPGHRRARSPSSFRSPLWWSRCARPRCSHRSESQKKNFTLPTNRTCRKQLIRKKYLIKHKQVLLWIHSELLEGKMLENHSHNKENPECIFYESYKLPLLKIHNGYQTNNQL